ncbi:MAG: hypothetical protein QG663_1736, partial [Thermodesulfobacteriota bacterium]|nr:hypothetical protein [Thermodesulfobacteriota bacterium]
SAQKEGIEGFSKELATEGAIMALLEKKKNRKVEKT